MSDTTERYPHCDPRVLHAPKECSTCDDYAPKRQAERKAAGINFTGQSLPGLKPCPADEARGVGQAHKWYGNAPNPRANTICPRCGGPAFALLNGVECLSMVCLSPDDRKTLEGK